MSLIESVTAGTEATEPEAGGGAGLASPFAGAQVTEAPPAAPSGWPPGQSWSLSTPFADGLAAADELDEEAEAFQALVAELEDEEFDEAVDALVDAAAARHLTATASWSSESEAPALAAGDVESWLSSVAGEADRVLEQLEGAFADRSAASLGEGELEAVVGAYAEAGPEAPFGATEDFITKLVKKARQVASGAVALAKRGVKAIGKLLPLGRLFGLLRRLVPALLRRVLAKATGRLPAPLRPLAARLAAKLGAKAAATVGAAVGAEAGSATGEDEADAATLGEEFDARLAELMLAPSEEAGEQLVAEAEAEAEEAATAADPVAALDAARARLARQLAEAAPGTSPVEQVQQFIPAVMAALPLVRMGVRAVGRERVVGFVANRLADLIKGHVGSQAARALARPIASAGLGMLGLEAGAEPEAESGAPDGLLGAEALVSTIEDTVREVASLPPASVGEPLRLEAELQQAFSEAVARHLPRSVLRADLPTVETEQEGGVWMMMPRATRPCFRYRKYSRRFPVAITRPMARAVVLSDGGTLERRLLDDGARGWPVAAEVELYEAVAGTQLGHLAAFEADADAEAEAAEAAADVAGEFEELTPEAAALLTGEAGLARRAGVGAAASAAGGTIRAGMAGRRTGMPRAGAALRPGARVYRLRVRGAGRRRRWRRFAMRLDLAAPKPTIRVHVRLSERGAGELADKLARRAHVEVVAAMRELLGPAARALLAARLVAVSRRALRAPLPPDRAAALAAHLAEAVVTAVAKQLPTAATTLAQAARDPASGLTLSFAFTFAGRDALATGTPEAPTMTIRAGHHRD